MKSIFPTKLKPGNHVRVLAPARSFAVGTRAERYCSGHQPVSVSNRAISKLPSAI